MPSDFKKQLSIVLPSMAAEAYERSQHLSRLDGEGSLHPPHNYLRIAETLLRFRTEFLPLSPLMDPRGRRILIRETNFPKFLNLRPKQKQQIKRAHTIIEEIDAGTFREEEYEFEQERLQSLFWIPDVIRNPHAIYRKRRGFGVVEAEEVYLKVYRKQNVASPVKVVFTQRVGGKRGKTGSSFPPTLLLVQQPNSTLTESRSGRSDKKATFRWLFMSDLGARIQRGARDFTRHWSHSYDALKGLPMQMLSAKLSSACGQPDGLI